MFMRKYQEIVLDKPELVFENDKFELTIPSASVGGYKFEHLKPRSAHTLLSHDSRKRDEWSPSLEAIVHFITGGDDGMRSQETDIYGVVQLKMEDISSQIIDIATLTQTGTEQDEKKAAAEFKALRDNHLKKASKALQSARELADERVKRALLMTHTNLVKQWDVLQQEGKGRYTPSIAEAVGAHILKDQVEKASAKKREMVERMSSIVNNTVVM